MNKNFEPQQFNNLDEFDHRPPGDPYLDLLDGTHPDDITLEERYADLDYGDLEQLMSKSFYDDVSELRETLPRHTEVANIPGLTDDQRLLLGASRWIVAQLFTDSSKPSPNLQMTDRIQNAFLGSIGAMASYDSSHAKFISYIKPFLRKLAIRSEMGGSTYINNSGLIRVPEHQKTFHSLAKLHQHEESIAKTSLSPAEAGITNPDTAYYQEIHSTHQSLGSSNINNLPDHDPAVDPEALYMRSVRDNGIDVALGLLSETNRLTLDQYLGLSGSEPKTLQEIGDLEGLSHQAVSYRLKSGLDTLRQHRNIRDVLNGVTNLTSEASKTNEALLPKDFDLSILQDMLINKNLPRGGLLKFLKGYKVTASDISRELEVTPELISNVANRRAVLSFALGLRILNGAEAVCQNKLGVSVLDIVGSDYPQLHMFYRKSD